MMDNSIVILTDINTKIGFEHLMMYKIQKKISSSD